MGRYLKEELILIFESVKKRLLKLEFNVKFIDLFKHTLFNGLNAQNLKADEKLFLMFRKQLFILLFAQADTFINEEIKNNKHLKLIIKQHRKRRICMPGLGKFKIERTQFKTKTHTGTKTIILFDFFFNFRKRGILLKGEEINILTQLTKTSSMQEIANSCGCSRQTISNYCKKLIYNSEERVITKEDCIVYVAADSTFTHMNRKKGRGLEVKTLVL